MKLIIIAISFLLPVTSFCQILNSDFEDWGTINNIEEPDYWETNNELLGSTSVTKTQDSHQGDFALQIINDGPSFEGPGPGYASTIFTSNVIANTISAYVKCDSISGTGKSFILINGYTGSELQQIGYWETTVLIPQYELIEIPLSPVENYDSIQILISSTSILDPTGWPTGFARLKVDQLSEEIISSTTEPSSSKLLEIFPNPCDDELHITNPEGVLSALDIYDAYGRLISHQNLQTSSVKLNVQHYQDGLYVIRTLDQHGLMKAARVIVR